MRVFVLLRSSVVAFHSLLRRQNLLNIGLPFYAAVQMFCLFRDRIELTMTGRVKREREGRGGRRKVFANFFFNLFSQREGCGRLKNASLAKSAVLQRREKGHSE